MAPPTNIPPVTPAPAKPAGPSGQVLQVVTLPEGLKNNARAIRLEGEAIGQNKDGSTRIKTAEGNIDVTFRGKQPQVDTKLEVEVPAGNPPRSITVRPAPVVPQPLPTIPILPQTPTTQTPAPLPTVPTPQPTKPDKPTQPTTQQPAPTQPTTKPAPLPSLPPLTTGDVVEIVPLPGVIAQTKPAPIPNAPLPQTPAQDNNASKPIPNTGAHIEDGIVQKPQSGNVNALLQSLKASLHNLLQPPNLNPQTGQTAMPLPANTVTATSITLLPTSPATTQIVIPDLPQTAPLIAKIMAITSPTGQTMYATPEPVVTQTENTIVPQTPSQNVTVTVTSLTPQNQPVIPLPLNINGAVQNFVIQTPPATLPVGAQVTLMPMAQQTMTGTAIPSIVPQAWRGFLPFMQASSTWPAMDDLFQTFFQATPQAAQILGRAIPSPANAQSLGPAIMLFAAAARAGELQSWIGDKKLEMIHKLGKDSLVSRLSSETASLSNNNDLPATEWKSLPIPMLWQNEISKVMFHVRQEPQEGSKQDKDGNTRFILDLSLPRMGEVQLDGIVNGKRLDLIVRTQMPVSYPMQEAMKIAYAGALDGSDVFGELSFQGDLKQWMHVIKGDESFTASA